MDSRIIKFMEWHGYLWSNDLQRFITQAEAIKINLTYVNNRYGTEILKWMFGEQNEG